MRRVLGAPAGITGMAEGWRQYWSCGRRSRILLCGRAGCCALPHAIAQSPLVDISPASTRLSCPRYMGSAGLWPRAATPGHHPALLPKSGRVAGQKQSPVRLPPPWAEPSLRPLLPLLRVWVTHPPAVPCPGFVPHHPPPLRQGWPRPAPAALTLPLCRASHRLGVIWASANVRRANELHVATASEGSRHEHRLLPPCRVLQTWSSLDRGEAGCSRGEFPLPAAEGFHTVAATAARGATQTSQNLSGEF